MDEDYDNRNDERKPMLIGAAATVGVHVILVLILTLCGLSYMYPPPAEAGILIKPEDMPEPPVEMVRPIEAKAGVEPRSPNPNPDKPVELVQKSEAQHKGKKQNLADEATVGDKGDVEVPEPKRKQIDKRALFSSAKNSDKDTLAAQTADRISDALIAGHPEGNTKVGALTGEPSAQLAGRQIMGSLPLPKYSENESGKVVIKIVVDAGGNVTSASVQPRGTTVSSSRMREAAREAALKAKFSTGSAVAQEGTITYIFYLK
jgi:TonB family protein